MTGVAIEVPESLAYWLSSQVEKTSTPPAAKSTSDPWHVKYAASLSRSTAATAIVVGRLAGAFTAPASLPAAQQRTTPFFSAYAHAARSVGLYAPMGGQPRLMLTTSAPTSSTAQ